MFDSQFKSDPSQNPSTKDDDDDTIVISDYLKSEKKNELKTEGYYVNKLA